MAEKYGTVPPRFTKAWWEYFWDYYKWHVIITIIALLIAAVTITQCATREKYDMNIVYVGHMNYSQEEIEKTQELLEQHITDVDENGENSILFNQLVFLDTAGSEEYDYAIQTKLDVSFLDDCSFVYLFDKAQAELQLQKEAADEIFECTDSWAKGTEAEILTGPDGKGYAVNLKDSKLLKDNNIYCDDLYVMIRQNYKDDKENTQAHEDSINVAEVLVK